MACGVAVRSASSRWRSGVERGSSPMLAMECRKGVGAADGTAMGRQEGEVAGLGAARRAGRAGSPPDTGSRAALRWKRGCAAGRRERRRTPEAPAGEGPLETGSLESRIILAGARGRRMQRGCRAGRGNPERGRCNGCASRLAHGKRRTMAVREPGVSGSVTPARNPGCASGGVARRYKGDRNTHDTDRVSRDYLARIRESVALRRHRDVVRRARPADDDWNASARHASERTRVARVASARHLTERWQTITCAGSGCAEGAGCGACAPMLARCLLERRSANPVTPGCQGDGRVARGVAACGWQRALHEPHSPVARARVIIEYGQS